MRKFLVTLAVLCFVLSAAACGGEASSEGIVIVPRNGTDPVPSETIPQTETETHSLEAEVQTEESLTISAAEVSTDTIVTAEGTETDDCLSAARKAAEDPVFLEAYERYAAEEADALAGAAAMLWYLQEQQTQTEAAAAEAVYWSEGGSVWHASADCSALARSKTILSGSVEEARAAGKARGCKRCTTEDADG